MNKRYLLFFSYVLMSDDYAIEERIYENGDTRQ